MGEGGLDGGGERGFEIVGADAFGAEGDFALGVEDDDGGEGVDGEESFQAVGEDGG